MSADIDFDELDKAVNNLMGNVKPDKDEVPKAKTLEVKDTLQPGEDPEYEKLNEVAKKIGNETLVTEREQTLVEHFEPTDSPEKPELDELDKVLRSIGDDSSATNAKTQEAEPPVQPTVPTESRSTLVVPPPAPAARVPRPAANGRFMDVVHPSSDMRAASTQPSAPALAVPPRQPAFRSTPQTTVDTPIVQSEDQALLTPFLPDANDKVEKRPLGAVPSPFTAEHKEDEKPQDADQKDNMPAVAEAHPVQDDEAENENEKAHEPQDDQRPVDATEIVTEPTPEEKALQAIESQVVDEQSLGMESIEKVESGDTEQLRNSSTEGAGAGHESKPEGAIYDTEQYHQPLGHPKKQKSGWGKVVIILLIIIICASVAGAAYLLLV